MLPDLWRATKGLTTRNGRSRIGLEAGAGGFQCQQLQLLLIMGCQNILERGDGVEQIAVPLDARLGRDHGGFCANEPPTLKTANVLCHSVFCHAYRFANRFVAGPALARFPVGTAEQIGVDGQLAGAETEDKNLVGKRKCILQRIGFLPPTQPLSPPFVCCSTHATNFSLGTTSRLPIFNTGKSASCINS